MIRPAERITLITKFSGVRLPFLISKRPTGNTPKNVAGMNAMNPVCHQMHLLIQSMKQSAPSLAAVTNLS